MWSKVTVEQFIELQSIKVDDYTTLLSYQIERISIIEDKDIEDYDNMTMSEISELIRNYQWLDKQPRNYIAPTIDTLHYKGIKTITLGEYIDLDYFYSENYFENLPIMCAILYRKQNVNEWSNETIEPYSAYNPHERKELFYDIPITEVYGLLSEWSSFKENILSTYANVFEQPVEGEEETKDLTPEERKELEKEIAQEKKMTKWGWERIIHKLACEDITKYDKVLNLNFIFVMNNLSMRMDLDI
jgi:hypothetical protein